MIFEQTAVLDEPFDVALDRVKRALGAQGFGTLTEIDMKATMKQKLDKDMESYVIVGACNPGLASRALDAEPQMGVLLPCNVVVRQGPDGVIVEAMDPGLMAGITGRAEVEPIADEARSLLAAALTSLG